MNEIEVIAEATKILLESDIYFRSNQAYEYWERLKKEKNFICEACGKEGFTHYHHIDKTLRPEDLFYGFDHINFWADKKSILFGPKAVFDYFINYYGVENINKSVKYYSVARNELMELCPSCHRKIHSKNGLQINLNSDI